MTVETEHLPIPHMNARRFGARCIPMLTDDRLFERTGVRIAFTGREGGVSVGPYASLNLGNHVGDDASAVEENRALLLEALEARDVPLVVPSQVHGDQLVRVAGAEPASIDVARGRARAGADGIVVDVPEVAALLCFADCVPVIVVSPTGRFAVVHAGWRGVENGVAAKAVRCLTENDAADLGADAAHEYNVYVGPHIHAECFETGSDVRDRFSSRFGSSCVPDERHVNLLEALTVGLEEAGIARERVADAGVCTMCSSDDYFSYRAEGGVCGRHGAVAFRKKG